jgi:hypothetical protein
MSKHGYLTLSLAALALLCTSCDWKSDGQARLKELFPVQEIVENELYIPDVHLEEVTEEGLSGRWIMEMRLPGSMDILGLDAALLLTNLFIADIALGGEEVSLTFCHQIAQLDAGGLGESEMPAETAAGIGKTPISLPLDGTTGVAAGKLAWTWGLKEMESPLTGAIPDRADSPLVWDQDEDGNPGVTLHVLQPAGDRYMVRRAVWTFSAADVTDDGNWMEGTLEFTIDEAAVGYDGPSTLKTIIPVDPSPDGGGFRLRRVGGAGSTEYDCAKLKQEYLGVFGAPQWPPEKEEE